MSEPEAPTVLIYRDIEWDDPSKARPEVAPPRKLVEAAKKTGARRKKLVKGEEPTRFDSRP